MKPRRPCKQPGCANTVQIYDNFSGYCDQHHQRARKCLVDDCDNRVAAWSKSGCCSEHRDIARKLRP